MRNYNLDYENKQLVRIHILHTVVPSVYETLVDDYYEGDTNLVDDCSSDYVWEIIDGLYDVIYNYQAKKVSEAFDVDVFGESEITGERHSSYNQIAFEVIYQEFYNQYGDLLNV